jgi:hypothetical protein
MEILLYEKRQGFQSGAFFLDGIAAALASHLIRWYSADAPVLTNSVGGMTPCALRRCLSDLRTPASHGSSLTLGDRIADEPYVHPGRSEAKWKACAEPIEADLPLGRS